MSSTSSTDRTVRKGSPHAARVSDGSDRVHEDRRASVVLVLVRTMCDGAHSEQQSRDGGGDAPDMTDSLKLRSATYWLISSKAWLLGLHWVHLLMEV